MNVPDLLPEIRQITLDLLKSQYKSVIDGSLNTPVPFLGNGDIRLIILGQDPTIQNPNYRKKVKVTLLLNQQGALRTYLENICDGLKINLDENVYATNLFKNFFTKPPDQIRKEYIEFLEIVAAYWIPLLLKEISLFPDIPILTLGEPVLNCLLKTSDWVLIRNYWGYQRPALYNEKFDFVPPDENVLNRIIFPFPHLNGLKHVFYFNQYPRYINYIKQLMPKFPPE